MLLKLTLLGTLILSSTHVVAMTGEEFLSLCSPSVLKQVEATEGVAQAKSGIAFCTAWVRGVSEGHIVTAGYYKRERLYCVKSDDVLYSTLVAKVGRYIERRPEKKSLPLAVLTLEALHEAF